VTKEEFYSTGQLIITIDCKLSLVQLEFHTMTINAKWQI